jgi:hypothetical protein
VDQFSATRPRLAPAAVYLVAAAMPVLFGLYTLTLPLGRDQGIHAGIATGLQHGFVTYSDVYNIKPPMTTAAHWLALTLFGHTTMAIRLFDLVATIGAALALAAATRRLVRSAPAAIAVAAAYAAFHYAQGYLDTAQTDGWAGSCVAVAILLLTVSWEHPPGPQRFAWMLAAGAMLGVAFGFKYTVAACGLIIFAPLLARDGLASFHWRDLVPFVAGGLAVLALIGAVLMAAGALGPYLEIQHYLFGYLGYGRPPAWVFVVASVAMLATAPVAALGALIGAEVVLWRIFTRQLSLMTAVAALALVGGWISATAQGKGFSYHYLPMIVGAALLFGFTCVELQQRLALRRRTLSCVWAAVFAGLLIGSPSLPRNLQLASDLLNGVSLRTQWARFGEDYFNFAETVAFSDILSRYRTGDAPFFVWGHEAVLYFLQDAAPAYRYPYAWPFETDYYDGRYTDDLLRRLSSNPPPLIVVQKQDAAPWATGRLDDSDQMLAQRPRIAQFVQDGYSKIEETPRFDLWQRKDR